MVHSAYLIDMRHAGSRKLSFNEPPPEYQGPFDDIIQFAFSAKYAGMLLLIHSLIVGRYDIFDGNTKYRK